jgi:hypothetical protein
VKAEEAQQLAALRQSRFEETAQAEAAAREEIRRKLQLQAEADAQQAAQVAAEKRARVEAEIGPLGRRRIAGDGKGGARGGGGELTGCRSQGQT